MKNAQLKIDRASKHISELCEVVEKEKPFQYMIQTDTNTGERATFAKANESAINSIKMIAGDVIHNLRSAIDYAYWDIVHPFVDADRSRKQVQFPFTSRAKSLEKTVTKRRARKVSESFFNTILSLKPYSENGGNKLLALIHELDILDKHRFPTPMGDYKKISTLMIKRQIPDFPSNIIDPGIGTCRRDVVWSIPVTILKYIDIGSIVPPSTCIFEKKIDVPVDIVFNISEFGYSGNVIETLDNMRTLSSKVVTLMYEAV